MWNLTSYSVYVGDDDRGFIIAESLSEAESRAWELYPGRDREEITVSFLAVENVSWEDR